MLTATAVNGCREERGNARRVGRRMERRKGRKMRLGVVMYAMVFLYAMFLLVAIAIIKGLDEESYDELSHCGHYSIILVILCHLILR